MVAGKQKSGFKQDFLQKPLSFIYFSHAVHGNPHLMIHLTLNNNNIESNISFNNLPLYLEYFNIANNYFNCIINLSQLSNSILTLNLLNNTYLTGYLDFTNLFSHNNNNSSDNYNIWISKNIHCDASIYCQQESLTYKLNCIETNDRRSNYCNSLISCIDTCSTCNVVNTNESCLLTGAAAATTTTTTTTSASTTNIDENNSVSTMTPTESDETFYEMILNDTQLMIYIIVGFIILVILLVICFKHCQRKRIEKKKERVRKQAEEQIYARQYAPERRLTNALTAGVHTGNNINEKDWQAVEAKQQNSKNKSKMKFGTHAAFNTLTFDSIDSANNNSSNYNNNNGTPIFKPNEIFPEIPMSNFAKASKAAQHQEHSYNNSHSHTPSGAGNNSPMFTGVHGQHHHHHGTQGSGHLTPNLTPIALKPANSGSLSKEMLFRTQEQFDIASQASFHKQSHSGGRLSPRAVNNSGNIPSFNKVSSQSIGTPTGQQNNNVNVFEDNAPRMFSHSIVLTEKNIKFTAEDDNKNNINTSYDDDDDDGDNDNGDNNDDEDKMNFISYPANINANRQRSITDLSPEIAYQQQKKLNEIEKRKQMGKSLRDDLENGILTKTYDNDENNFEFGVTQYGNDTGIVDTNKRVSFSM